jgi:hypothetical protein
MKPSLRGVALAFLAGAWLAGAAAAVPASDAPRVSYLVGGSVYVAAGEQEGLAVGDTVVVERDGRAIAWLRVAALSSHRVSCDTLRTLERVRVGDPVAFTARAVAPATAAASPGAPASATRAARPARLHGRLGARYLTVDTDGSGTIRQPALDLRLDGTGVGGLPLDVGLDLRGRRVTFQRPGGGTETDDRTRVYRLSVAVHDSTGRWRLTVGRQISPALSPVNLFDGALAERRGARWSAGLFTGAQPEPLRIGLSGDVVQGGGFVEWHQPAVSQKRWSFGGGAVSSYQGGSPNREFGFVQLFYLDRGFSAFGAQEVDLNRGWKRDLGEPTLAPTSTYLHTSLRVVPGLSLRAGFDNRRSVRLYRDRVTPETEFDDRWRQGSWGGLSLDLGGHLRLGGEARTSAIGGSRRLNGWSGAAELVRLGPFEAALRGRLSHASGAGIESDLASLGLGLAPMAWSHVELTGGLRRTKDPLAGTKEDARWESADLDLMLARRIYLNASLQRDHGGLTPGSQAYFGLSWRF